MSAPAALTLAFLGGTGPQGQGLARRFALAGYPIVLGSRHAERAQESAAALAASTGGQITGMANAQAAAAGDVVIVAVPWDGHGELLATLTAELAGKIVIDCVNPLGFDSKGAFALAVAEGSAAEQAALLLPESRIVGAFHHISAELLADAEVHEIATDVLVLGDDREATDLVQALVADIPGMRGIFGGRLRNAHQVEAMTANLISINRRYKTQAGLRVTGL